jgi:hypothetical protein
MILRARRWTWLEGFTARLRQCSAVAQVQSLALGRTWTSRRLAFPSLAPAFRRRTHAFDKPITYSMVGILRTDAPRSRAHDESAFPCGTSEKNR